MASELVQGVSIEIVKRGAWSRAVTNRVTFHELHLVCILYLVHAVTDIDGAQ